jgi:short-subunit dehydrogenase
LTIQSKVVLITGASQGIGAACAAALRARGAKLSLTARSAEKLEQVGAGDALTTAGDVTDPAVRQQVVARTLERYGAIDILINNAGVGLYAPSWSAPLEDIRALYELNIFAAIAMTQLVVPHMRERRSGTVVNVSSIAGSITLPWFTVYSSTKFALGALTNGLRMELAADGVRAMLVCPGYVQTGFQDHVLGGRPPERLRSSKKFAITAEECAEAIVRGLEDEARTVTAPGIGRLLVGLYRLWPGLVEKQMDKMNERQQRQI